MKQLCDAYSTTRQTLSNEFKKIPGLKELERLPRLYSPAQQEIIYKHLGNPFE